MAGPDIIALCNQKGGVGKTTCALNIAVGLTLLRKKVLVIDFDPQAHLTYSLGLDAPNLPGAIDAVMKGEKPLADAILDLKGLQVLPAGPSLAKLETELAARPGKESLLKDCLAGAADVSYVIIDCPPSAGLLTVNALVACREVFIPLQMEFLALKGMSRLLTLIEDVRKTYGTNGPSYRVIPTRYDARKRLNNAIMDKRKHRKSTLTTVKNSQKIRLALCF